MTIERVDPLTLDAWTAEQMADAVNASLDVDTPKTHHTTGAWLRGLARHTSSSRPFDAQWVARQDGRAIGCASLELLHWDNTDTANAFCYVHPDHRRRGVGTALLEHQVAAAQRHSRTKLFTFVARDSPAEHLLVERGGVVGQHATQRRLEPPHVDYGRIDRLHDEAAAQATDYEVVSLVGIPSADWWPQLVALADAINDAPMDDIDLEDEVYSVDRLRQSAQALADRGQTVYRVLARRRHSGEWAGHTILCIDGLRPGLAFQEDTSVVRAHRGHRLGMLLKTRMLLWMRDLHPELTSIDTWNADSNSPMIAVNVELGCRVVAHSSAVQMRVA